MRQFLKLFSCWHNLKLCHDYQQVCNYISEGSVSISTVVITCCYGYFCLGQSDWSNAHLPEVFIDRYVHCIGNIFVGLFRTKPFKKHLGTFMLASTISQASTASAKER